jgi:serine/threonine protein kinase
MQLINTTNPKVFPSSDQPQIISCWRLGEQVTGGRHYHIFRAAPKTLAVDANHDYVIKLVNPDLGRDQVQEAIDRLGREALATEQILHPNIIRLLDAELDQAPFFLVQPWVYGRSLDTLFSRAPHFSLSRMLWVMRQVAEGVRAGHERGRVYLGIDPSHVMIGKTGRVSLIGWAHSHAVDERAAWSGDQLQLARYTAPECFQDEYRAIPASDVYSMGVLIYHALALKSPFDGHSVEQISAAHASAIPEDLIIAQPDCPPRLGALVKQMLAKDPDQRPSFRQVLNDLISIEIEHLSDAKLIYL